MIDSNVLKGKTVAESYTDLSSLNAINKIARTDKNKALGEVAKQFESMMVRMMMKSMRSANEVFAEGNMLSSHAGDMYQDMYDDQLAVSLSTGRGMGVADVMVQQLRSRFGEADGNNENNPLEKTLSKYKASRVDSVDLAGLVSATPNTASNTLSSNNGIVNKTNSAEGEINFNGSTDQFIKQLYPMAKSASEKLGVSPEILIAQSALETGWGKKISQHSNGQSSFNLFNIKASNNWQGKKIVVPTLEYKNGVPVKEFASFRSYQTPQQSFDDYVDFISHSPRYSEAMNARNDEAYIKELSNAGYATDPEYSSKVIRVLNSEPMKQMLSSINNKIPQG